MAYAAGASPTIFAVIAIDNPTGVGASISDKYPGDNNLVLAVGQWLVVDTGTAQSVSEKLGITVAGQNGANAGGLVIAMSGYFGSKPPTVWEWIKAKWGGPNG